MKVTIEAKSGHFSFDAPGEDRVLLEGLAAGLGLPYECATGTCGTCRARVMEGEVEMLWPKAPGAAKLRLDRGDVLMCQARAKGDCLLRVPSNIAPLPEGTRRPQPLEARISLLRPLTSDVMEFVATLPSAVSFDAGQFAVVEAPGVEGGRAYSMVNHAEATERLTFVVKRKPGGGFSEWLFTTASEGADLRLFGPIGRATFRPAEERDVICVAGGSGVAGMVSILDHATRIGHFGRHKGVLYFGVRTLADGFYVSELAGLVRRAEGGLSVNLVLSHEEPAGAVHPEHPEIALGHGFVHEAAARGLEGRSGDAVGFVAGPGPMVDGALRVLLTVAKIPPTFIRYDKFG